MSYIFGNTIERGTWTPIIEGESSAGDYSLTELANSNTYIKIDNLVILRASFEVTINSAGSGRLNISGHPYIPSEGLILGNIMMEDVGVPDGNQSIVPWFRSSSSVNVIILSSIQDAGSRVDLTVGDLVTGSQLSLEVSYKVV